MNVAKQIIARVRNYLSFFQGNEGKTFVFKAKRETVEERTFSEILSWTKINNRNERRVFQILL